MRGNSIGEIVTMPQRHVDEIGDQVIFTCRLMIEARIVNMSRRPPREQGRNIPTLLAMHGFFLEQERRRK